VDLRRSAIRDVGSCKLKLGAEKRDADKIP